MLEKSLGRPPRWKGGRPPFDPVLKFRMLVLQSLHGLSLDQIEYLVRDRLSWMRFCQLGPEDRVPDANTLWDFREALIAAGALSGKVTGTLTGSDLGDVTADLDMNGTFRGDGAAAVGGNFTGDVTFGGGGVLIVGGDSGFVAERSP